MALLLLLLLQELVPEHVTFSEDEAVAFVALKVSCQIAQLCDGSTHLRMMSNCCRLPLQR